MTPPARRRHRLELDALASQWQLALDAAQHALDAAHGSLPDSELASRAQALRSRADDPSPLVREHVAWALDRHRERE